MNLCTANNGTQKFIFEGFGKKDNIVETPKDGDVNETRLRCATVHQSTLLKGTSQWLFTRCRITYRTLAG
jgi:hypothetical protein